MLKYHRYHCYTPEGKKIIRCFPVDSTPINLDNHTQWVAGTGPITGAALERLRQGVGKTRGRPKSPEHREKMSKAALGRPKSPEHCLAMSRAHLERSARLKGNANAN